MAGVNYFDEKLFAFLNDLKANNNREWFNAHKDRYELHVKQPLLMFIADFAPKLRTISPHFVADPRGNGGSMFRIYRDIRFAKDKRPYKTAASAHFRHEAGKNAHAPGFYLHLEPGNVFAGMGLWRPDGPHAALIREAIADSPTEWTRTTTAKRFTETFHFGGASLKRPPRGFSADHALIDDLKRKDFIIFTNFSDAKACSPGFLEAFTAACKGGSRFMHFLTDAVGHSY